MIAPAAVALMLGMAVAVTVAAIASPLAAS